MSDISKDFGLFAKSKGISSTKLWDFEKDLAKTHIRNGGYIEPTVIEERQLNAVTYGVFSRLLMERIVWFGTTVDSDSCNIVASQLMYLDSLGDDDINLYINTNGGDVFSGLNVVAIMDYINSDVSTYCMGMCASMGAILLSSGTKGKRYALPYGQIMIHQPIGSVQGQASDIEITANHIKKTKNTLIQILSDTTGQPFDKVYADCDRDLWFNPIEAKEYGLIDDILSKKK